MTAPARSCGPCTLCCKVMRIRELDKPPGSPCPNIAAGKGCAIYDIRPRSCRTFICGWLQQPAMPDALRPDRTKVLLHMEHARRLVARCDPDDPEAWRRDPIYVTLKGWAARAWPGGHELFAAAGDRYWAITPTRAQPDLELGVLNAETPFAIDLMSDGRLVARSAGSV